MTKRERVIAAFRGQEVDHVPVCMWKHVPQEFWADDDAFAAEQARAYRNTDVDFMKLSADRYFTRPSEILENIRKADELYRLEPLGPAHPHVRGQIERTAKVVKALGPDAFSIYLVFAPLCCIRQKIGYDRMMELIREDPEAMKYACAVVAEDQKLVVKGVLEESGVDGIFFSVQNAEEDRFTFDEYRKWVTPSEKTVLDYANSLSEFNAIHFCAWAQDRNRVAVWHDYKAPVVSWSRYIDIMDIGEARKFFGATMWGGFDNRAGSLMFTGTREEIERETASLVAQGGKRGYILGADCSMDSALEEERIRWVAEASRKI